MKNFICNLWSSKPSHEDALEIYRRIPIVGGTQGNLSQQPNLVQFSQEPFSKFTPSRDFSNNVPKRSVSAGQSQFAEILDQLKPSEVIRQIKKSDYLQIEAQLRQEGVLYTDSDFPPEQKSLGEVDGLKIEANWRRISSIVAHPVLFGQQQIYPEDISFAPQSQRSFLTALSSLAENEFRLRNLFVYPELHRNGIYVVRLLHRGELRQVIVDDYVPINGKREPLFAWPSRGGQIWPMILEKSWAKLHGSYGDIIGRPISEILRALTGAPTIFQEISANRTQQQRLWTQMMQVHLKGGFFCATSRNNESVEKYGLAFSKTHNILGLFDSPTRLVKIRSPCSDRIWKGRASHGDNQFWVNMNSADRQNLKMFSQSPTIFIMLWADFLQFFETIDICLMDDNANMSHCSAIFDRKRANLFQFTTKGGNMSLTLSQSTQRISNNRKPYSRSTIIIARYDKDQKGLKYSYVTSSSRNDAQNCIRLSNLPGGTYIVYAKIDWLVDEINEATISLYSSYPSYLISISQTCHKGYLYSVFLDHARRNPKKQALSQKPNQWICTDLLLQQCGYGYVAIHLGEESTQRLGIQINENEYSQRRVILKKPYRGRGLIRSSIEPGQEWVLLFRVRGQQLPSYLPLPTPKIYNLL